MKTFILASKNQHKANEVKAILGSDFDVITQTDAGAGDVEVIEDGKTFEENAIKKAETIMKATGKPVIADDSGLCVDYLDGAPGIYTARYAGENATDDENIDKLLKALENIPEEKRSARFVCVIALSVPGKEPLTFRGECLGKIGFSRSGDNGFGYDPIFRPDGYNSSIAEVSSEVKNSISHRGNALKSFADYLKNL